MLPGDPDRFQSLPQPDHPIGGHSYTSIGVSVIHPALTATNLLQDADEAEMPPPFRHMTPLVTDDVAQAVIAAVRNRPFGTSPVVLTGSHNLGPKASATNDENLLLIRNAPSLADAYVTAGGGWVLGLLPSRDPRRVPPRAASSSYIHFGIGVSWAGSVDAGMTLVSRDTVTRRS